MQWTRFCNRKEETIDKLFTRVSKEFQLERRPQSIQGNCWRWWRCLLAQLRWWVHIHSESLLYPLSMKNCLFVSLVHKWQAPCSIMARKQSCLFHSFSAAPRERMRPWSWASPFNLLSLFIHHLENRKSSKIYSIEMVWITIRQKKIKCIVLSRLQEEGWWLMPKH